MMDILMCSVSYIFDMMHLGIPAAKISFHGSYGAAHDYADVADDMIGVFEWNVTSYATEWYVPVVDLVEIYK